MGSNQIDFFSIIIFKISDFLVNFIYIDGCSRHLFTLIAGAAMKCAILSPAFKVRDFSVKDSQPYRIKVSWAAIGQSEGGYVQNILG